MPYVYDKKFTRTVMHTQILRPSTTGTALRSLKIASHDKVMSGLVMKIAEARLKHLVCVYFFVSALTTPFTRHTHTHTHTQVHERKLRIVSVSVDLNQRAYSNVSNQRRTIEATAQIGAFNLTVKASTLRRKTDYKWVVLKSFAQIRNFVHTWREEPEISEVVRALLNQACSFLSRRRMSRTSGKKKYSLGMFRTTQAEAQSFSNQMTQVSLAQEMFNFLCEQDSLSISHEFLKFLAEPDHFVGMEEG